MSGIRYLLDTNAVISIINGNQTLLQLTSDADFVYLSVISVIEFLSFSALNQEDKDLLYRFISETEVIDLTMDNSALLHTITQLRSRYKIKLPDAIIAATAMHQQAILITNDKHFTNISSLQTITY